MSLYLTHKYFTAGHQHWISPDGQLGLGVDLVCVVEPGVVQVVADAGRQQHAEVALGQGVLEPGRGSAIIIIITIIITIIIIIIVTS